MQQGDVLVLVLVSQVVLKRKEQSGIGLEPVFGGVRISNYNFSYQPVRMPLMITARLRSKMSSSWFWTGVRKAIQMWDWKSLQKEMDLVIQFSPCHKYFRPKDIICKTSDELILFSGDQVIFET